VHNSTEKAIHGGDGGAGGTGGTAEAYAGSAGCATVGDRCGQPGHAKARSDGGDGGIPGGSGWTENLSQTIKDKCSSNSHDLCWEPDTSKDACGYVGIAGEGGNPGTMIAESGDPDNEQTYPGDDGSTPSHDTGCDHDSQHSHI
jgi:hypothetical protein